MEYIPLSRFAPSPFSRMASPFGNGDAARAAGRPLHGCHGFGRTRACAAADDGFGRH